MTYYHSHCCKGSHHYMHFHHNKHCTCHSHSQRHYHHSPSYSPPQNHRSHFNCCCCCSEFRILTPLKPKKQDFKPCSDHEDFKDLLEELVEEILIERFEKKKKKERY